jgi:hypothetical protein
MLNTLEERVISLDGKAVRFDAVEQEGFCWGKWFSCLTTAIPS